MADHSGIEWTDATWSPVTGCAKVSPGCANCYIERTPPFRVAGRKFADGRIPVLLHPEKLDQPLRWKKPRMIFVCSMSDLFHEDVSDGFIARVFEVMRQASQHTFQVLTKRPERMRDFYFSGGCVLTENIWLGTTIENARYTYRADVLREIPAAIRFISAEPLLGSLFPKWPPQGARGAGLRWPLDLDGIEWVICGGESGGRSVRPMHPAWAREIRDACADTGTAFFFKQWGSYGPAPDLRLDIPTKIVDGGMSGLAHMRFAGVSGKSGGKLLDGREWCEIPSVRALV